MCSVNKGAQAFVFVTDTYKQLTRPITELSIEKWQNKNKLYTGYTED